MEKRKPGRPKKTTEDKPATVTFVTPWLIEKVGVNVGYVWPTLDNPFPLTVDQEPYAKRVGMCVARLKGVLGPRGELCGSYETSNLDEIAVLCRAGGCIRALNPPKEIPPLKKVHQKAIERDYGYSKPPLNKDGGIRWGLMDVGRLSAFCIANNIPSPDPRLRIQDQRDFVRERFEEE